MKISEILLLFSMIVLIFILTEVSFNIKKLGDERIDKYIETQLFRHKGKDYIIREFEK